jgi:hypothetical protein
MDRSPMQEFPVEAGFRCFLIRENADPVPVCVTVSPDGRWDDCSGCEAADCHHLRTVRLAVA